MARWIRYLVVVLGLALSGIALSAAPDWFLDQIYTNANGSVQFVVFRTTESGQQHLAGHSLMVTAPARSPRIRATPVRNAFTFPNDLPGDSTNRSFLVATAGFANLHRVTPDYVVPNRFFPIGGGSISLAGNEAIAYPRLPTDGVHALHGSDPDTDGAEWGFDIAEPINFADALYTFEAGSPTGDTNSNAGSFTRHGPSPVISAGSTCSIAGLSVEFLIDQYLSQGYVTLPCYLPTLMARLPSFISVRIAQPQCC